MSLSKLLIVYLSSNKASYKKLRSLLHSGKLHQQQSLEKTKHAYNEQTLRTTLYRLQKKGLLEKDGQNWNVTAQARKEHKERLIPAQFTYRTQPKSKNRKIICMFDVPESERIKRNWLRSQLEVLDFTLLQQSVWIGPAPLPTTFIALLEEFDCKKYIRFLEVTNDDIM
jgi:DNA-binding transcriptional regulator PaaX